MELQLTERPPGWEGRLVEVLRAASTRPYNARTWNCARFAHACAVAVSGRDIPFRRRGTLEQTVNRLLPRVEVRQARRGDVVLADGKAGAVALQGQTLGVCVGARAAFVTKRGLVEVARRHLCAAWSV